CILCNQYLEITKKGRDGKNGLLNTQLLVTAMIIVYILIAFYFIDLLSDHAYTDAMQIGEWDGESIGKIFGLIAGGIIFLLLKNVIGPKWYERTIQEFNTLSAEEKEDISKRG